MTRCNHTDAEGRRCRTPLTNAVSSFCPHHARQHLPQNLDGRPSPTSDLEPPTSSASVAPELLGPIQDFRTATAINYALSKLFVLLAEDRIPPRNAAVLAYICQLMLQSLDEVKQEVQRENWRPEDSPELQEALERILQSRSLGTPAAQFVDAVLRRARGIDEAAK